MKQFHLLITGDVQGVGFRSWMKQEAEKLKIAGWVKNREDRAVEAVIQGTEEHIKIFIDQCRKGPEVAWVENIEITQQPIDKGLFTFEVIY